MYHVETVQSFLLEKYLYIYKKNTKGNISHISKIYILTEGILSCTAGACKIVFPVMSFALVTLEDDSMGCRLSVSSPRIPNPSCSRICPDSERLWPLNVQPLPMWESVSLKKKKRKKNWSLHTSCCAFDVTEPHISSAYCSSCVCDWRPEFFWWPLWKCPPRSPDTWPNTRGRALHSSAAGSPHPASQTNTEN